MKENKLKNNLLVLVAIGIGILFAIIVIGNFMITLGDSINLPIILSFLIIPVIGSIILYKMKLKREESDLNG